jgi:hypothetical protein
MAEGEMIRKLTFLARTASVMSCLLLLIDYTIHSYLPRGYYTQAIVKGLV